MILGPGCSTVATAATYTIFMRCGGAVSLRRAPSGSAVLRHRGRRRIPRAQVLMARISAAAAGVAVAESKQQWSLLYVPGTVNTCSIGPQQAASVCLMLRPDAPAGRGHRQWSWDGSDAPRGRPYRAVWSAQIAQALGSFLGSGTYPGYRTATDAALCMGVRGVHECVLGRLWVR